MECVIESTEHSLFVLSTVRLVMCLNHVAFKCDALCIVYLEVYSGLVSVFSV